MSKSKETDKKEVVIITAASEANEDNSEQSNPHYPYMFVARPYGTQEISNPQSPFCVSLIVRRCNMATKMSGGDPKEADLKGKGHERIITSNLPRAFICPYPKVNPVRVPLPMVNHVHVLRQKGNPVYVPCNELPQEVELVECSINDVVGKKICDAEYLTEKHYFLSKEFICGTVDDMLFLGGGIAIASEVVNVIHSTVDQNKKDMRMLVQIASHKQHVNCIRGKRPISEGSSSKSSISFSDADLKGVDLPYNDSLVISLKVGGHLVDRILVDPGSAIDVMYINLFKMLKLKLEDLNPTSIVLHGFNDASVQPMRVVTLLIYVKPVTVQTQFLVIDVSSTYNAIVGRPWLHKTRAVPSTFHQLLVSPQYGDRSYPR
ncbi:unnamed protein product [Camellia sinensis]